MQITTLKKYNLSEVVSILITDIETYFDLERDSARQLLADTLQDLFVKETIYETAEHGYEFVKGECNK